MSERWTGLKGKPQSANMGFLLQQGRHRFPGPGYWTFSDQIRKEKNGYERLMRRKINETFASHDDDDEKNNNNNKNNLNESPRSIRRPPTAGNLATYSSYSASSATKNGAEPLLRGIDYTGKTLPRPTSARDINTKPLLHLNSSTHGAGASVESAALTGETSHMPHSNNNNQNFRSASTTSSTTAPNYHSYSDSGRDRALNYNVIRGSGSGKANVEASVTDAQEVPVQIDRQRMYGLTNVNAKRLKNIWPNVATGWNNRDVQQTLILKGRDCDESPLRTVRGGSVKRSSGRNQQQDVSTRNSSGSPRSYNNNNYSSDQHQHQSPRSIVAIAPRPPSATSSHNNGGNNNDSTYNSTYGQVPEQASSYSYNRRIRAPAVPEPFLGKRGVSRQYESEQTTVLLRKLTDLEEEIRHQQQNRSSMEKHVRELRSILLHRGENLVGDDDDDDEYGEKSNNNNSNNSNNNNNKKVEVSDETVASLSNARNRYFTSGAHERRNVRFSN